MKSVLLGLLATVVIATVVGVGFEFLDQPISTGAHTSPNNTVRLQ